MQTISLDEALKRHQEALDALVDLRTEYEEARATWRQKITEAVAEAENEWRARLEAARREHAEDLRVLREEQIEDANHELEARFEKEKKDAVWQAKQEVQSRYEDQLSGMLRAADAARKAALAKIERELADERKAHELTRQRLESKETELENQRATADRWYCELDRLRTQGSREAEASRKELDEEKRRCAEELTARDQQQFFRAAAFAKAYRESQTEGAGESAQERLAQLIEEFVREYAS